MVEVFPEYPQLDGIGRENALCLDPFLRLRGKALPGDHPADDPRGPEVLPEYLGPPEEVLDVADIDGQGRVLDGGYPDDLVARIVPPVLEAVGHDYRGAGLACLEPRGIEAANHLRKGKLAVFAGPGLQGPFLEPRCKCLVAEEDLPGFLAVEGLEGLCGLVLQVRRNPGAPEAEALLQELPREIGPRLVRGPALDPGLVYEVYEVPDRRVPGPFDGAEARLDQAGCRKRVDDGGELGLPVPEPRGKFFVCKGFFRDRARMQDTEGVDASKPQGRLERKTGIALEKLLRVEVGEVLECPKACACLCRGPYEVPHVHGVALEPVGPEPHYLGVEHGAVEAAEVHHHGRGGLFVESFELQHFRRAVEDSAFEEPPR